jgi:hypothetical protein
MVLLELRPLDIAMTIKTPEWLIYLVQNALTLDAQNRQHLTYQI